MAGTVVSFLLFLMALLLARIGKRAEGLAAAMTMAARAREAKFRSYVERAPPRVRVADARGQIVELKQAAAELLGRASDASQPIGVLDLCPPEDRNAAAATLLELARKGEMEAEWRLARPDGGAIWLLWRAVRF